MRTHPTWILFDVGGVLLDWFGSSRTFAHSIGIPHQKMLDAFQAPYHGHTLDKLLHQGAISPQEAWNIALKPYGKSVNIEDVIAAWCANDYWIQDSLELLDELKDTGYHIAILSNSWFEFNNPSRSHLFPEKFSHCARIFDSGELGYMKPDKKLYELVEQTIGVPPGELFFIDDNQDNLDTANERGWQTHYFESRKGSDGIEKSIAAIRHSLL